MILPIDIEGLAKHPDLYLREVSFDAAISFITGYDIALRGSVLLGFQEWLIPRVGYGNNLHWSELVLQWTFKTECVSTEMLNDPENNSIAFDTLFQILSEFFEERQSREGMRRIFLRYERWLCSQEWYSPSSPMWIESE